MRDIHNPQPSSNSQTGPLFNLHGEHCWKKKELTAAAGQSAPVDDADDVSSMDSPELAY